MEKIVLTFDNNESYLSGYSYGKRIFKEQVKNRINYNDDKIIIVFPSQIKLLTSSFIQGFFAEIHSKIGLEGIEKKIFIENSGNNFKENIIRNLI